MRESSGRQCESFAQPNGGNTITHDTTKPHTKPDSNTNTDTSSDIAPDSTHNDTDTYDRDRIYFTEDGSDGLQYSGHHHRKGFQTGG